MELIGREMWRGWLYSLRMRHKHGGPDLVEQGAIRRLGELVGDGGVQLQLDLGRQEGVEDRVAFQARSDPLLHVHPQSTMPVLGMKECKG